MRRKIERITAREAAILSDARWRTDTSYDELLKRAYAMIRKACAVGAMYAVVNVEDFHGRVVAQVMDTLREDGFVMVCNVNRLTIGW